MSTSYVWKSLFKQINENRETGCVCTIIREWPMGAFIAMCCWWHYLVILHISTASWVGKHCCCLMNIGRLLMSVPSGSPFRPSTLWSCQENYVMLPAMSKSFSHLSFLPLPRTLLPFPFIVSFLKILVLAPVISSIRLHRYPCLNVFSILCL